MMLAAVAIAAALVPATRPIQAVDAGGQSFWVKSALAAQQGDTIEWRLTQPGNAVAAAHDVWLTAPDGVQAQLAQAGPSTGASAVVDQLGTYSFHCSVHDGMTGTIAVGADDPGPVEDPGTPWTSAAPAVDGGLANTSLAPAAFELGDTLPPTVALMGVTGVRHGARVRVRVSEPGTLTIRLVKGSRALATRRVKVKAGTSSVTVRASRRTGTRRVRVQVQAKDLNALESATRSASVWIGD